MIKVLLNWFLLNKITAASKHTTEIRTVIIIGIINSGIATFPEIKSIFLTSRN